MLMLFVAMAFIPNAMYASVNDVGDAIVFSGCTGPPAQPGTITGSATPCYGSNQTYTVAPVTGATSYTWTIPVGWTGTSTTNSITVHVMNSSTFVTCAAVNSCGTSTAESLAVTVMHTPIEPGVITGPTSVCAGSVQTYTIAQVQGATSYSWSLPGGGWSGTSTTTSITVTVGTGGGNIIVHADNACGQSSGRTLAVTVMSAPNTPGVISGPVIVCAGSTVTYTIAAVTGATSYIWGLPGGWTGTSASTSITTTVGTTGGLITVRSVNACGTSANSNLQVQVISSVPAQPGAINGNASPCDSTSQTYFVVPVTGATSYIWTTPVGWTGTSTTNSIVVNVMNVSGTITVKAVNACGSSPATSLSVIVGGNALAEPGPITGPQSVCAGSIHTYTISAVTGATSYIWSLPGGWSGTSTGTSITVTVGTTGGLISVIAHNSCGNSVARNLQVAVVTAPQAGPINGNVSPCQGSSQTYTITPVSGGTYTWTLPTGWTGSSTTNSMTATVGANGGYISVTVSNACGSVTDTLQINVSHVPAMPGPINGMTSVCAGSTQTYTITQVSGATSYTWQLPGGWSGNSTTTSITTTVGSAGTITVTANNACGSSAARTLAVTVVTIPPEPGPIIGDSTPCQGSTQTYTISAVTGATSYTWTLPGGWTGTSTTTSITTTVGQASGTISVTACNSCGCSPARTLTITVMHIPLQPGPISGNDTVCSGSSQTYSISPVAGATSYIWTLPNGWTGSSTTTSINTIVGANGGTITVTANNACGSSPAQTLSIIVISTLQVGTITGPTQVCQGSTVTYTVAPVTGATSYTWTHPSGWIGTSTTNSITFTVNSTSGNITVKAVNGCGAGVASTLAITNVATIAITGNPSDFNFCAQVAPTYVILTATSGFNAYAWSPSGGSSYTATVSTANTYTVSATDNAYGCTAIAICNVTNNCAVPTNIQVDSAGTVTWTQSQCAVSYTIRISVHNQNVWTTYTINNTNSYQFSGLNQNTSYDVEIQTNCTSNGNINSGWSSIYTFTYPSPRMMAPQGVNAMLPFNIYPNPANDEITITFSTMDAGSYSLKLFDMMGRELKSETDKATNGDNTHIMNLDGMAKGIYTIILQKGDIVSKSKLVVE